MAVRIHLFPSRTQKLSSPVSTILGWRRPGKIERRRHILLYSSIAQSVERMTVNHDVTGSSPVGGAKEKSCQRKLAGFFFVLFIFHSSLFIFHFCDRIYQWRGNSEKWIISVDSTCGRIFHWKWEERSTTHFLLGRKPGASYPEQRCTGLFHRIFQWRRNTAALLLETPSLPWPVPENVLK